MVADFVTKLGAGLVVLGTRGHTGLAGVLLGSVAQDVIAHVEGAGYAGEISLGCCAAREGVKPRRTLSGGRVAEQLWRREALAPYATLPWQSRGRLHAESEDPSAAARSSATVTASSIRRRSAG